MALTVINFYSILLLYLRALYLFVLSFRDEDLFLFKAGNPYKVRHDQFILLTLASSSKRPLPPFRGILYCCKHLGCLSPSARACAPSVPASAEPRHAHGASTLVYCFTF